MASKLGRNPAENTDQLIRDIRPTHLEVTIMWHTPEYSDIRFGFEVTMYICNR